jgi:hypothetical protein
MLDTFRTLLLAGIGTIDLSEEKMRQLTADLVRRGELATEEARKLVAAYAARSAERERSDESALAAAVAGELARQGVASTRPWSPSTSDSGPRTGGRPLREIRTGHERCRHRSGSFHTLAFGVRRVDVAAVFSGMASRTSRTRCLGRGLRLPFGRPHLPPTLTRGAPPPGVRGTRSYVRQARTGVEPPA